MASPTVTTNDAEEELLLDRYFSAVWRAKWFIIILTLAAAGVTAFIGRNQPGVHTATGLIEIGKVWKEPLEDPYTTTEIINSAAFAHELGERTGNRPARLHRGVRGETVTGGSRRGSYPILVRITANSVSALDSEDYVMHLAQAVADALVERHAKLFDDAMAPHLERQQRIERHIKELKSQPGLVNRDTLFKLESELDEVKANNVSPTLTQKTHLVGPIVADTAQPPSYWRSTATAALIAAIAGLALAVLLGHFRALDPGRTTGKQEPNDAPNN
ncbi:MAG TPA: hypothetical protein VJH03_12690 [Blastocatellia bacterium]|nr:hypothetical protein [Blastocatellia bacterium]